MLKTDKHTHYEQQYFAVITDMRASL